MHYKGFTFLFALSTQIYTLCITILYLQLKGLPPKVQGLRTGLGRRRLPMAPANTSQHAILFYKLPDNRMFDPLPSQLIKFLLT